MRLTHIVTSLPLFCVFAGAAMAQPADAPCTKQLSMVNEIQMESHGPGASLVPIEINGAKHSLTFATAGTTTQLTEDAAKSLGLEITRGETTVYDDNGTAYRNQVTVAKLGMGTLQGTGVHIPISPNGAGGGSGLFSLNHMLPYDVDVDFGTDKLRFFSQDHCPGGVLYWQASVVGVAPITIDSGRVTIPVEVDGKALTGVIDTAAASTSIRETVATKVMNLELGSPTTPVTSPGNYSHTVASLRIGSLGLRNIKIAVRPDGASLGGGAALEARNRFRAAQRALLQPEITIGMDLLRKLHLYMAFGEKKLYVTPGSPRTAAVTAASSPAAN